ncbi:peptidase M48 [Mycobacterium kansasii]|nr:peptidase M48 [Mycobacterium kansasii]
MNAALLLLLYASMLTWLGPLLLRRVTGTGVRPQLAVACWLTAVVAAIAAWLAALVFLCAAVLDSIWRHREPTLCFKALGVTGQLGLPQAIASAMAICLSVASLLATTVVGWRVAHQWLRQRSRSLLHASAARVVGGVGDRYGRPDLVVVPAPHPAAYCVTGRPDSVVVVTTAALDRLDEPQLAAVLAHEYAHLAGRHHDLLMVLRAIAASLPRLTLFCTAAEMVADLLEMCADDVAVRRHGKMALLRGLLALTGAPPAMTSTALGAAGTATLGRASRLANPISRRRRLHERVILGTTIGFAVIIPLAVGLACYL